MKALKHKCINIVNLPPSLPPHQLLQIHPLPPPLLLRRPPKRLHPPHRLHVQVRHVLLPARPRLPAPDRHAHLELRAEHHVVLPQPPPPVEHAQHPLLHLHLRRRTPPAARVVLAPPPPVLRLQHHPALGVREPLLDRAAAALARPLGLGARRVVVVVGVVRLLELLIVLVGKGRLVRRRRRRRQVRPPQRLVHRAVVLHLGEPRRIDRLARLLLLHEPQHAVVEVLVEVLRVLEHRRARAALARGVGRVARQSQRAGGRRPARRLAPAVRRRLLDVVHGGQVTLKNVGAVERLLGRRAGARAEAADHRTLVVRQGVAVLVVLAREALGVVVAGRDGALLGPLGLVGEHVCFEVLEGLAAVGEGAVVLGQGGGGGVG